MSTQAGPAWDRWQLLASPMFAALSPVIERLPEDHFPTLAELNRLCEEHEVVSGNGVAVEFVPQEGKTGEPYEKRVYVYGKVLTRSRNWHDLFNALAWITFPKTKAALNRHHYREMSTREGGELRGAVRDALTLFDESGVIVASGERSLSGLLTGFEWKELFWERREDVLARMRFYVFGHAIYEKALDPYKGLTAKAVIFDMSKKNFDQPLAQQLAGLDAQLARMFGDTEALALTEAFAPLPVLGIPGWTPDNEDERYYDDAQHFRAGRKQAREGPEEIEADAPVRISAEPGRKGKGKAEAEGKNKNKGKSKSKSKSK